MTRRIACEDASILFFPGLGEHKESHLGGLVWPEPAHLLPKLASPLSRIFILGLQFSNGHNFMPSMNHDVELINRTALMFSFSPHVNTFLKIRSGPSQHLFSIIDLAK